VAIHGISERASILTVSIAKALELFMISLVTKAATQAKCRSSKRVVAGDLKQAVLKDVQFDFLNEIVGKVADAPTSSQKNVPGGDGDSDDGGEKKKRGGRRKKRDADEF
jgi:Dr1-associated corepressor